MTTGVNELNETVARAMGLEVVGLVPVQRDPECGGLEVSRFPAMEGEDMAPAYLAHCFCEHAEPDEARVAGHCHICVALVPDYLNDANAFAEVKREIQSRVGEWETKAILHELDAYFFVAYVRLPGVRQMREESPISEAHALLTAFVAAHKESLEVSSEQP